MNTSTYHSIYTQQLSIDNDWAKNIENNRFVVNQKTLLNQIGFKVLSSHLNYLHSLSSVSFSLEKS